MWRVERIPSAFEAEPSGHPGAPTTEIGERIFPLTFCLGIRDSLAASATLVGFKAKLRRGPTKILCHGRWSKSQGANLSFPVGLQLSPSSMSAGLSSQSHCITSKVAARAGLGTVVARELCLASTSRCRHLPPRISPASECRGRALPARQFKRATSFRGFLVVGSELEDEVAAVKLCGARLGGGSGCRQLARGGQEPRGISGQFQPWSC